MDEATHEADNSVPKKGRKIKSSYPIVIAPDSKKAKLLCNSSFHTLASIKSEVTVHPSKSQIATTKATLFQLWFAGWVWDENTNEGGSEGWGNEWTANSQKIRTQIVLVSPEGGIVKALVNYIDEKNEANEAMEARLQTVNTVVKMLLGGFPRSYGYCYENIPDEPQSRGVRESIRPCPGHSALWNLWRRQIGEWGA